MRSVLPFTFIPFLCWNDIKRLHRDAVGEMRSAWDYWGDINVGRMTLDAAGALPLAVLGADVAYAYRSSGVAAALLASLVAGALLRWGVPGFAAPEMGRGSFHGPLDVLHGLDILFIPVVVAASVSRPHHYVGSVLLLVFLVMAIRRYSYLKLPVSFVSVFLLLACAVGASVHRLKVTPPIETRWEELGWAAVSSLTLFVLACTRMYKENARIPIPGVEIGVYIILFVLGGYLWKTDWGSGTEGLVYLAVDVRDGDWEAALLRLPTYLALVAVVALQLPRLEKNGAFGKVQVEIEVVCIASASVVALPLLALSPFVVLPLIALLLRGVAFLAVYKTHLRAPRNVVYYAPVPGGP